MSSKPSHSSINWDSEADVIVVGFGGAGASAALEAFEQGADTLVLERFGGGGATRMSGGIYYGGGTSHQKAAGFEDSADDMYAYLEQEARGIVSEQTLRKFCEDSEPNLRWLESHGVEFGHAFCPFKTSYPIHKYDLYYSGNESFSPFVEHAKPAPRGHKPRGKGGMGGKDLFSALQKAVLGKDIRVQTQSPVKRLITDDDGRVVGVEARPMRGLAKLFHVVASAFEYRTRYITLAMPPFRHVSGAMYKCAEAFGRSQFIRAKKGVVLSSGGFIFNRDMVREADPRFLVGTPLGCHGDNGSGINMGREIGASVDKMSRISAWRFINPPLSFTRGILVNRQGERLCNEMLYGARTGDFMCTAENNTEAFLIVDNKIWRDSHRDSLPDRSAWFQWGPTLMNLYGNCKRARTIESLAMKVGINATQLPKTLEDYNKLAANGGENCPLGKPAEAFQVLKPPYISVDCSLGSKIFACATLTMGGLVVNEETGEVKREDGSEIKGLYAAGRTAVGVCSHGYASGLAISDCVFSGRRASSHAMNGS